MLNKNNPFGLDRPNEIYGIHKFDNNTPQVGPGHSRIPTDVYTSEATGEPHGLLYYNDAYIRILGFDYYNDTTLLFTLSSEAPSCVVFDDLLIVSDGNNIFAYDKDNPTWGLQQLGNDAPILVSSDFTPTTGGSMDEGNYYYCFTYVDAWGYESPMSETTLAIVDSGNSAVAITNIPMLTSEKGLYTNIYRTYLDDVDTNYAGVFSLVAQVTSDSYIDFKNDAELTYTLRQGTDYGDIHLKKPEGTNLCVVDPYLTWTKGNVVYISNIDYYKGKLPGETSVAFSIGDDSNIIATAALRDTLLVFKRNGIYRMAVSKPYGIVQISDLGIANNRHVIEWMGGVAFISGWRVYYIDSGIKEIMTDVTPLYDEYTSIVETPFMMKDHKNRLYISARVESHNNPTWANYKYVTYITDGRSTSRTINFDWKYMLPDPINNKTVGLDHNGYMERLLDKYAKCKVYSPIINATHTVVNSTKIRFTPTLTGIQAGDYIWYYSSTTDRMYTTKITETGTEVVGITNHTYIITEDALFTSPLAGDKVAIGAVYTQWGGPIYDDVGTEFYVSGIHTVLNASGTNCFYGFGNYNTYNLIHGSAGYDSTNIYNIDYQMKGWYLRPCYIGLHQDIIQVLAHKMNISKGGKIK